MLTNLQLNCDLNYNLHLVFSLGFCVVGHFLYIVRREEQLHFPTVVTFPPVKRRQNNEQSCLFCDEHA